MYHRALILVLFASLALAQTSPRPQSDVPPDPAEHQRHEDDNEPPPASAASVLPGSPVITIEGICDRPSGADPSSGQARGQESSAPDLAKKESDGSLAGSTTPACKTIVTKAQFEKLVEALNPQMPGPARRQLAESYPRLLLFANKARELGLDQDPRFAEAMRFASIQLLTQRLNRYFEEQASRISDSDVEKYYKGNTIKFEREELLRIFVPKQTRQAQTTVSRERSSAAVDSPMLTVAEKIQTRAAAGDDFEQLQKEAFEAAGISSGSPHVSTGKIAAVGLPLNHQKVFEMEPGQVSELIADPSGYYIYKVVSKQMVPLAQVSKEIRKRMASQRVQDAAAALANSIKSELDPMYFGSPGTGRPSSQRVSKPGDERSAK
ncbi:MAG: peptidylprolyl isomerase [Candidatus Sulfotelmatobacter sp.]